MSTRFLDLNTRNTLEHWSVAKALTELLANALDEATESKTELPTVYWEDNNFVIQDNGRGLKTEHFQQSINPQKHNNHAYIGKFGVGLKDALVVLFNKGKAVILESRYFYADKLELRSKHEFDEKAIHVMIQPPRDKKLIGTTITVSGITKREYREVRNHFQVFADLGPVIADTRAGKLYARKKGKKSAIYLNGIKVNEEADFLYQYAVVGNTKKIMTATCGDRDRNNVTRNVYAEKIQQILEFACKHVQEVRDTIADIFNRPEECPPYDELKYAKIKALTRAITDNPEAEPVTGEVKPLLLSKKKQEAEESSSEEEIGPTPQRVRIKVRFTPEDAEYREDIFAKGRTMLSKMFSEKIPAFQFEDDPPEEDALCFTRDDIKTDKVFFRRLMRKYVRYCLNDPDEESPFIKALVSLATAKK